MRIAITKTNSTSLIPADIIGYMAISSETANQLAEYCLGGLEVRLYPVVTVDNGVASLLKVSFRPLVVGSDAVTTPLDQTDLADALRKRLMEMSGNEIQAISCLFSALACLGPVAGTQSIEAITELIFDDKTQTTTKAT